MEIIASVFVNFGFTLIPMEKVASVFLSFGFTLIPMEKIASVFLSFGFTLIPMEIIASIFISFGFRPLFLNGLSTKTEVSLYSFVHSQTNLIPKMASSKSPIFRRLQQLPFAHERAETAPDTESC
ncbi:hypothetical protein AVEN_117529-1 [Araneus ventricosus]|uniref:Uncharacterized protein n=1 Tax=Araneus ventricosus TaxID=182803 RepID=A0A4Y2GTB2_ARAVE|nr:hypothetical protein AVEN_117529-1 [Araneus ventricosus]